MNTVTVRRDLGNESLAGTGTATLDIHQWLGECAIPAFLEQGWASGFCKEVSVPGAMFFSAESAFQALPATLNIPQLSSMFHRMCVLLMALHVETGSLLAEPQKEVGTYPIVTDREAQPLLGVLDPSLRQDIRDAIERARNGISVGMLRVRRSTEPEDPGWEELVFDVQVYATADEALAYWDRIGALLENMMESVDPTSREQLERLISVHVDWR
jgi:hypothetical protein